MEQIIKSTISKAIKMLEACNCKFAIIDPDGKTHGELEVSESKKRKSSKYPYGELRKYLTQYLDDMKPGDVAEIPLGKYDFVTLQSSASSTSCVLFGNGSCTTTRNLKNKTIEVLRVY